MKTLKIFLITLVAGIMFIGCASTNNNTEMASTADQRELATMTDEQQTQSFTVDGLQVITNRTPGNPVVAVGFYLDGGTKYVPKDMAGIERLMFDASKRGTVTRSKDDLNSALESMGTTVNTDAAYDYNGFQMTTLKRNFDASWELYADMLLHPTFPEEEIALVKSQQLNNIKSEVDDPDSYLRLVSNDLYYSGHPYAVSLFGTEESVNGITSEVLAGYHKKNVTKSRGTLVVVGDVTPEEVRAKAKAVAAELPADSEEYAMQMTSDFDAGTADLDIVQRDLPTNYIRGMCNAPAPGTKDYPAFFAAMNILDDKLFEEIRTKRNLSYAPASGISVRSDNYAILYVTTVKPDTTVKVMFETIDGMIAKPLPEKEVKNLIAQTITRNLMQQETAAAQRNELIRYEYAGGGWENSEVAIDKLMKVTPADVQRVLKRYAKNFHFGVIGNPDAVDEALFTSK